MYYYQKSGKLLPFTDKKWISENHYYRYGSLNKKPYYSEEIPRCNLCGSELNIMKKGKTGLILSCTNPDCKTNHTKKSVDCKLIAFLPKEYYETIKQKRKDNHHSYYDIDYLVNTKGMSKQDAEEYIEKHKKIISDSNTGHNKKYFIEKYGEETYTKNLKLRNELCVEYWINKGYSLEEAKKIISEKQSKRAQKNPHYTSVNKQYLITKIGEENVEKFFRERSHFCVEYWLKMGYSEKESREKIHKIQSNNSKQVKNRVSAKTIDYWLNKGYSEKEAKEKLSDSQRTFSKEKCIEKYGEIEGLKLWKERQDKWQTTLHKSENLHVGFSKVSQELFKEIDNNLGKNDYTFYGSKNHEYCIRKNGVNYIYDFTDLEHNKIIEFQGDIYHGNPDLFTENEHPNPFHQDKTCKDLWEFDAKKSLVANEHGFEVLQIWEKEYRENKDKIIDKSLKFILND